MSDKAPKLPWSDQVDDSSYEHAYDYLSLHWLPDKAGKIVEDLKQAPTVEYLPGDLIRTSVSPNGASSEPLPLTDPGVTRMLGKALSEGKLSPILCVNLPEGIVIADGRHRANLAYALAPARKVPLKLGRVVRQ